MQKDMRIHMEDQFSIEIAHFAAIVRDRKTAGSLRNSWESRITFASSSTLACLLVLPN